MKFWLLPPLIDILNKREEKIKHILRQADKLSAQAERIQKKYQQYIDGAHQYSVRILQTAHDEIEDAYGISMAAIARREAKEEKKHHGRL
jgi:F0F1-type ATP synthase membrane subunit b/b'